MPLNITIGKNSDNQPIVVELCSLPHLFVAYSYDEQLTHFLQHCINTLNTASTNNNKVSVAIALCSTNAHLVKQIKCPISHTFLPDSSDETLINSSKDVFIQYLFEEMKTRLKNQKSSKKTSQKQQILIVIIDELFSLILSQKKQTGIYFLQLLILGKEVGIHFIAASASTYRNLLLQLINMHPDIEKQLAQKQYTKNTTIIKPLGAELILTPDDLVFYKSMYMQVHERYFRG